MADTITIIEFTFCAAIILVIIYFMVKIFLSLIRLELVGIMGLIIFCGCFNNDSPTITDEQMIKLLNYSNQEFHDYATHNSYKFDGIYGDRPDYHQIYIKNDYKGYKLFKKIDYTDSSDSTCEVMFWCSKSEDFQRLNEEVKQLGFQLKKREPVFTIRHEMVSIATLYQKDKLSFEFFPPSLETTKSKDYYPYQITLRKYSEKEFIELESELDNPDELTEAEKLPSNSLEVINMHKATSGVYEIPVQLNGVLLIDFILDSGASDVSISPDVALTLIKTGTVSQSDFIGAQKYRFADGSEAISQRFIIHQLKIGDKVISNVEASISNSTNAPMLLGQTILQRLGKFTVDNVNHTLTINY